MKNMKKLLSLMLVLATLVCLCAACGQTQQSNEPAAKGENTTYTVTVKTAGGMAMEGVSVAVYADADLQDLQAHAATDANGKATLTMPAFDGYVAVLSGVPKGYQLESSYPITSNTVITLTSSLVQDDTLGSTQLGLGDVMYDFTVTTPDGTAITLSEMLKEKEMVLINFWYTGCSWCVTEFPFMDTAYQMYQDKVGIVAVDPLGESNEAIAAFPSAQGLSLSFPLAACPTNWANTFSITGYPTSVVVDRYGVIVLVEEGAITSLRPFTCLFDALTGDDYQQKLYNSVGEVVTIPEPTFEMASSEEISAILGTTDLEITYHAEENGESAKYAWPFVETEKNGEKCLKASNSLIEDSYAILYMDVTLKAGQTIGFDFLRSSETNADVMYVIVDGQDINAISGFFPEERWETCYPLVAEKDGEYEIALCYLKDSDTDVGDDTIYIKNVRILDVSQIDAGTYLPRQAATTEDGFTYEYVDIVFNSKDGYYHVGTVDGPLLLADLLNFTQFSEESSLWQMAYNGDIVLNGVNYAEAIEEYSNYASNSQLYGICTVNQALYDLLQIVDQVQGFDEADDKEWMKLCKYYVAYGTDGVQLEDPVAGLAPFSAFPAKLGKNVATNVFNFNRLIMPRGMFAKFVPTKSGVYRITSSNEYRDGVDGWIFDENKQILLDSMYYYERMFDEKGEISMVFYMEAGKAYYINFAPKVTNDQVGQIFYDIEYLGAKYSYFTSASPGSFTFDTDASGEAMYYTKAGGIEVVLGSDGIYYQDLGGGKKGSKVYADFVNSTSSISTPISSGNGIKGLIELGAFDFSKDEYDTFVLNAMSYNENDPEKTKAYLQQLWGQDFEENYALYRVDEVFAGIYHGKGEDYTEVMRQYEKKIIKTGPAELRGCVLVDEQLANILQMLMDKYLFEGVDHSWCKMCYYYEYMG